MDPGLPLSDSALGRPLAMSCGRGRRPPHGRRLASQLQATRRYRVKMSQNPPRPRQDSCVGFARIMIVVSHSSSWGWILLVNLESTVSVAACGGSASDLAIPVLVQLAVVPLAVQTELKLNFKPEPPPPATGAREAGSGLPVGTAALALSGSNLNTGAVPVAT